MARSLCSNLGGIGPGKLYQATLRKINITIKMNDLSSYQSQVRRIISISDKEERCSNKEGSFRDHKKGCIYPFLKLTVQTSFRFAFLVLPPTTATEGNGCFDVNNRIL